VQRQFHGVVKHPADHEQRGFNSVDQKVARPSDCPRVLACAIPTQSQVPRSNAGTKFRSLDTARSVWPCCYVAKRRDDQALIAKPRRLAELILRPRKDVDDVCLRSV
jgi:hypothetical protein